MDRRAEPPERRLALAVVGASAVVAALTLVSMRLFPATPPPPFAGRALPRMRMPATSAPLGDLLRAMGIGSLTWYACVLAAPAFLWMSRRLPIDRRRWAPHVAAHLAVIIVLTCVTAALQYRLSYGGSPLAPPLTVFLRAALLTGTLPFVTLAAAAQALEARARAYERELDAARAQGQLAEARLAVLAAQLQPHFLFNTLQAISTLIAHDPPAADRMLTSLSDLLREVLRRGERHEVALDEELRVLESYLDISRARFGTRLSVEVAANADTRQALVPFFVLQPLVENALHHGVSSRAGPASVRIAAAREDGRLWLTVTDDGPGGATSSARGGIGLPNTRARLQQLYGDRHVFDVGPVAAGGFRVRVGIPYRVPPTAS